MKLLTKIVLGIESILTTSIVTLWNTLWNTISKIEVHNPNIDGQTAMGSTVIYTIYPYRYLCISLISIVGIIGLGFIIYRIRNRR